MKIKVIGQDPSMCNWGLAACTIDTNDFSVTANELFVVQDIKEEKDTRKSVRKSSLDIIRARRLSERVNEFLARHSDAKFTMVEIPHGSQKAASMKGYAICITILAAQSINMIELNERECKLNALGKTSATKAEMIHWAMSEHPEANWKMRRLKGELVSVDGYNEHAADALSAVHAGLVSDQFVQAVTFAEALAS